MKKSFPFSYPGLVETDRRQGITQDVPLVNTFFFGKTGEKGHFYEWKYSYSYHKLVETYRNQVLQHSLTIKANKSRTFAENDLTSPAALI